MSVDVCRQVADLREAKSSLTKQNERLSSVERENSSLKSRVVSLEQQSSNGPTVHGLLSLS